MLSSAFLLHWSIINVNIIHERIDALPFSLHSLRNSITVEIRPLLSQPFTNSHFHFHINMQSVISQIIGVEAQTAFQLVLFEDWQCASVSNHLLLWIPQTYFILLEALHGVKNWSQNVSFYTFPSGMRKWKRLFLNSCKCISVLGDYVEK